MPDATLLVLQHIACEPPAAYEDELLRWGAGLHRVEVDEGEPLPDWRGFVLPWLGAEKQLIASASSPTRSRAACWPGAPTPSG